MTQALTPGFSLTDNLLLTEELPAPPEAAYRVWFALNVQLGQIVVIKVHADGRIEPIDTNPTPATPPVAAAPPVSETPPAPAWNLADPQSSVYVPPASSPLHNPLTQPMPYERSYPLADTGPVTLPTGTPRRRNRWLRYVVSAMVVLGSAIALYYYRRPVERYVKKVRARISASTPRPRPADSTSRKTGDNTTPASESSTGIDRNLPPPAIDPNEPTEATTMAADSSSPVLPPAAPITAQQAARLLNLMAKIPAEKHPAIFADARQAFTNLRSSGRQSYIDSLYTVCMGRGAQSVITYQQNGDPASKRYAVDWYQTAYALKPDPALRDRIRRLTNGTPKRQPKPLKKPAGTTGPLFMPDPEVNQ